MGRLPVRVVFAIFLFSSASVLARPVLQLSQTAVFAEVSTQKKTVVGTVLVANTGDGNFHLVSPHSSVAWLNAAIVSGGHTCTQQYPNATECFGIRLTVDPSTLSNGTFTGQVEVDAPLAANAPQNIVVTIVVGTQNTVSLYVAPGGVSPAVTFATDTNTFAVKLWQPVDPAVQLTVVEPMQGSWPYITRSFEYLVEATAAAGTRSGVYQAAYAITGLSKASEDETVPVQIHVTSSPIAVPSAASVNFSAPTGSTIQSQLVTFTNAGLGTLQLTKATDDKSWLSAKIGSGNALTVSANPTGLAVGSYAGTVTLAGNAANPITIPVALTVTAPGPPVVTGVTGPSAPLFPLGELVTIVGSNFTSGSPQTADQTKILPTTLNGAHVLVGNEAAPLMSVAPGAITLQVPYDANSPFLQVLRDGVGVSTLFPIQIVSCYPVLTSAVNASGVRVDSNAASPALVDANSTITIYGHGFGETVPPAPLGTPIPAPSLFGPGAFLAPLQVEFTDDSWSIFSTANENGQLLPGLIAAYQVAGATVPAPPSQDARPADVNVFVHICGRDSNTLRIRVR